jgi:hypothetical protein
MVAADRRRRRFPTFSTLEWPGGRGTSTVCARLLQTKEKREIKKNYFERIQEGENLDLLDISSSSWCQLEEDL